MVYRIAPGWAMEVEAMEAALAKMPFQPCGATQPESYGWAPPRGQAHGALVELVAGLIDKDEQPEEVAHREAQEEAGLDIKALWPMTKYFPSPGGSNEFVHLYLGRCSTDGVGGLHGLEEEAEDIRVTVWAFEDALQAVRDGRIANAASIIALQWLALNRAEVRGLWS